MGIPIRILVVEDSQEDLFLVIRHLRETGYEPVFKQVDRAQAMQEALSSQEWDLIIADYFLPQFSAPEALKTLKSTSLDLPFIIVSGTVGEEVAVSALKAGAHDYIMKNNLTRLGSAIERELRDAKERKNRKAIEERIKHDAMHDGLTGLPNLTLFLDRLERVLERSKRQSKYLFAVMFLDLDNFRIVNDSLGHSVGDQLIRVISQRLKTCLRMGDTVARFGGDEFVILLDDIKQVSDATYIATRIQNEVSVAIQLNETEIFTTTSIGVAFNLGTYHHAQDLVRDAEIAMYRAKEHGKSQYEIFDTNMHLQILERLKLEIDLRRAINQQEFCNHYQPIISLKTGKIISFESLIRWQHPERGLVSPMQFIPLAEETGLIIPIGLWGVREACNQLKAWHQKIPQALPFTMSVNISRKQLAQSGLVEQIEKMLQETNTDASCLKLEITESAVMENSKFAIEQLMQLKKLKIQLYMDDFGTGYSSLSYLHRLPIDALKIDRSFILHMGKDKKNTEFVRAMIVLAHHLGLEVIAEGVETQEQLMQLRELECEYAQGFFFSKPLVNQAIENMLAQDPAW